MWKLYLPSSIQILSSQNSTTSPFWVGIQWYCAGAEQIYAPFLFSHASAVLGHRRLTSNTVIMAVWTVDSHTKRRQTKTTVFRVMVKNHCVDVHLNFTIKSSRVGDFTRILGYENESFILIFPFPSWDKLFDIGKKIHTKFSSWLK